MGRPHDGHSTLLTLGRSHPGDRSACKGQPRHRVTSCPSPRTSYRTPCGPYTRPRLFHCTQQTQPVSMHTRSPVWGLTAHTGATSAAWPCLSHACWPHTVQLPCSWPRGVPVPAPLRVPSATYWEVTAGLAGGQGCSSASPTCPGQRPRAISSCTSLSDSGLDQVQGQPDSCLGVPLKMRGIKHLA